MKPYPLKISTYSKVLFFFCISIFAISCTNPEVRKFNNLEGEWTMTSISHLQGSSGNLPENGIIAFFQNEAFDGPTNQNEGNFSFDSGQQFEFRYTVSEISVANRDFFALSIILDSDISEEFYILKGQYEITEQKRKSLIFKGELRRGQESMQVEISYEKK